VKISKTVEAVACWCDRNKTIAATLGKFSHGVKHELRAFAMPQRGVWTLARTHAQAALYTRKVWAVVVERIKWARKSEASPLFLPMKLASHPTITALARWRESANALSFGSKMGS